MTSTAAAPGGASMPIDIPALTERVRRLRTAATNPERRTLVGIAGAPGAGKSTVAARLIADLAAAGVTAALVGMDGFHLAQAVLDAAGTAEIKGAPETFDPEGYLALLRRLRSAPRRTVYAPRFDRSLEEPIAGAVPIGAEIDVIVTEGNYLLLDEPPWSGIAALLDETWFLDVPDRFRVDRLVARHVGYGRDPKAARHRATLGSDGANARLVSACRHRADLIVTDDGPGAGRSGR